MGLGSGTRDPGSGKNYPGSRGQKGIVSRIPDLDPQHCVIRLFFYIFSFILEKVLRIVNWVRKVASNYFDAGNIHYMDHWKGWTLKI
jgi:hypothetical protein